MHRQNISASQAGQVSLGGELSVNRLGYGAMRLTGAGIWGPPKDRKSALQVLRRAIELGVNFIDTADSYGPFVNEEVIAEALFPYPSGLVIATKAGWNRPGPGQWTHDATPAHLREAIEGSLKRLRLDRIDLYQLHHPDPVVSLESSVETLAELRSEGKIRLVGFIECHAGAHRASPQNRSYRLRAEPLQLRGPRMGLRGRLLPEQPNCVYSVVSAGSGQSCGRSSEPGREKAWRKPHPDRLVLVAAAV